MYKVLAVDDEPLVLMGIQASILWEEEGFSLIGTAGNGEEALELIERDRPDIVLTDIKMPRMDGIGLLKEITVKYSRIKVIILSCLDEMETVREALVLGAVDYILKLSMCPDDLLKILKKSAQKIEEEKEQAQKLEHAEKILMTHEQQMKKELLLGYLKEEYAQDAFLRQAAEMNFSFSNKEKIIACMQLWHREETKLAEEQNKVLENLFSQNTQNYLLMMKNGAFTLVAEADLLGENTTEIVKFFRNIQKQAQKCGFYLTVGLSERIEDIKGMVKAFKHAQMALSNCFYSGENAILSWKNVPQLEKREFSIPYQKEKRIFEAVITKNYDVLEKEVTELFMQMKEEKLEPNSARNAVYEMCHGLIKYIHHIYPELPPVFSLEKIRTEIQREASFQYLLRYALKFLSKMSVEIMKCAKESSRYEIILAKQYIFDHIDKEITLEETARYVGISRSYFSVLFKQTEKESFNHYVNRIKMEAAKELLLTTNMHIYEIARKVGIENENYFSKLFRKYTGKSPKKLLMEGSQDEQQEK